MRTTDFSFRIARGGGSSRILTYDEAVTVAFGKPTTTLACCRCKKAFAIGYLSGCLDDAGQVVAVACSRCKSHAHGRWVELVWYIRAKLVLFQQGLALEENAQRDDTVLRSQLRGAEPPTDQELAHLASGFGSAVRRTEQKRAHGKKIVRRGRTSRHAEETVHEELERILAGA